MMSLPEVTQLAGGKAGVQAEASLIPKFDTWGPFDTFCALLPRCTGPQMCRPGL